MAKNPATELLKKAAKAKKQNTLIMGILNVTPDSFSDGGQYIEPSIAVKRAEAMLKEGADIIDIGGESTRPGSKAVTVKEEIDRVVPVIRKIREKLGEKVVISIDTNKYLVAEMALHAGANMVNSLGGFSFDHALADVVARSGCPIAIYHIKGEPRTMQSGAITYKNVVSEINEFFKKEIALGAKHGVQREQFILDPGIGFGKSVAHNLEIVKNFKAFSKLKLPTMIGASRKSHLGKILEDKAGIITKPEERTEAGLAEAGVAVMDGALIVRTHDVLATKKFLTVIDALK